LLEPVHQVVMVVDQHTGHAVDDRAGEPAGGAVRSSARRAGPPR
jgi:hypothetical protein